MRLKYCLLDTNGVVIQTQRSPARGFVECPESTVSGMVKYKKRYVIPNKPVEVIRAEKLNQIISIAKSKLIAAVAKYSPAEMVFWLELETQARLFLRNKTANVPDIENEAVIAGVNKKVLAQKIVEKADFFKNYRASVVGTRTRKEAELYNLADAEVATYDVTVDWPE